MAELVEYSARSDTQALSELILALDDSMYVPCSPKPRSCRQCQPRTALRKGLHAMIKPSSAPCAGLRHLLT